LDEGLDKPGLIFRENCQLRKRVWPVYVAPGRDVSWASTANLAAVDAPANQLKRLGSPRRADLGGALSGAKANPS